MNTDFTSKLSERIAEARRLRGLTQNELAALLSITPQAISKWETGAGLPDLTLLPAIASALGTTVGALMGETPLIADTEKDTPPATLDELNLISQSATVACYSDKTVDQIQDGIITFADGSRADLHEKAITNRGAGEIRFLYKEDLHISPINHEQASFDHRYAACRSLELSLSMRTQLDIVATDEEDCHVIAHGPAYMIARLSVQAVDGTLRVNLPSFENGNSNHNAPLKMTVALPLGTACGEALTVALYGANDVKVEPSFAIGSIGISGCGDVKAADFETLSTSIRGSGDITYGNVSGKCTLDISGAGDIKADMLGAPLQVSIRGSGDVSGESAGDLGLSISGSGSFRVKKITGKTIQVGVAGSGDVALGEIDADTLSAAISGSGDIGAHGKSEQLTLGINGSGDFHGEKLCVDRAELTCSGECDITLGQIRVESTERLSKESRLRVLRRGI